MDPQQRLPSVSPLSVSEDASLLERIRVFACSLFDALNYFAVLPLLNNVLCSALNNAHARRSIPSLVDLPAQHHHQHHRNLLSLPRGSQRAPVAPLSRSDYERLDQQPTKRAVRL